MNRFLEDKITVLRCEDGVDRPIHIWEADRPKGLLIAIHGGLSHAGDFCVMASAFKLKGWHMVSFDMRGHVEQEVAHFDRMGDLIKDLKLFVSWANREYPTLPKFVVAHSMGGLIAALYGLQWESSDDNVKGYVMSAPYWANAIRISPALRLLSGLLAQIWPKMIAPKEDFLHYLTHDDCIAHRIEKDQADNIRATHLTIRSGNELLRAHRQIAQMIHNWDKPLFVAVSGQDKLTDSDKLIEYLDRIDNQHLEYHVYPDNYHENFNELNREQIFDQIDRWLCERL